MQSLHASALQLLQQAQALVHRHPRRLTAGVVVALGGFAATAFGIAPLAPDAAKLPRQIVVETLDVPAIAPQLEALADHGLELHRHSLTRLGDTADSLLRRLGVSDPAASAFLRSDANGRRLVTGDPSKFVEVRVAADGTLLELIARFGPLDKTLVDTHFQRLTVTRAEGDFVARLETDRLSPRIRLGAGAIQSSLWAAMDKAQLPETVATQLIEIFSSEVDFHRSLRRGDTFSLLYEELHADEQPVSWRDPVGRVLAAEFVNAGESLQAIWFHPESAAKGAYYDPDGRSRQKSFLASPLEFSRVTSGFAQRFHPILQDWRAHNGVDYSAPVGTPVRTVANGVVEFAGRQSGYGNVVQVLHGQGKSTLYAHLHQIDVSVGQRLEQGQVLGTVGATGWATGPHLHFEVRVNGQFQDPMTLSRSLEVTRLDGPAQQRFDAAAQIVLNQLDEAASISGFRANAD